MRPGLAIISLLPRPDRVHVHERIAAEIPEIQIHSLFLRRGTFIGRDIPLSDNIRPVEFMSGSQTEDSPNRGISIFRDWRIGDAVLDYLRRNDIRMVILNGYRSVVMLRVIRWCRRESVPVLLRSDSNLAYERATHPMACFRAVKRLVVTPIVRRCDGVMPMGELGVRFFERYGARRERCFYSPSVPDYELFRSIPEVRIDDFRRRHSLEPERSRLLATGRFVQRKRFDLVIDAFAAIADQRPEWDLVLVGSGPLERELRQRVPDSLRPRVRFLGAIPWEEMPAAYASARVFVLPSDREPWGVVVLEAMLAGNAVIATDTAQAADELVADRISGRLFRPGDLGQLVECTRDVTAPERIHDYQNAARRAIEDWIQRRDPILWTRRALEYFSVIEPKTDRADSVSPRPGA